MKASVEGRKTAFRWGGFERFQAVVAQRQLWTVESWISGEGVGASCASWLILRDMPQGLAHFEVEAARCNAPYDLSGSSHVSGLSGSKPMSCCHVRQAFANSGLSNLFFGQWFGQSGLFGVMSFGKATEASPNMSSKWIRISG